MKSLMRLTAEELTFHPKINHLIMIAPDNQLSIFYELAECLTQHCLLTTLEICATLNK